MRDTDQYEFRPGVLVTLICRMYCNLSQQPLFATAVITDGRSYNSQLLTKAGDVLGENTKRASKRTWGSGWSEGTRVAIISQSGLWA